MGENLAERGPVATEEGILANTQKKNLRNHGGYRCGWRNIEAAFFIPAWFVLPCITRAGCYRALPAWKQAWHGILTTNSVD